MQSQSQGAEEQNTGYVTTVLDLARVKTVREQIGANKQNPALTELVKDADGWCAKGPFTVMQKALTPPSGDKHDYLSFGPYWWPDPAKKDGLPYLRRDGEVNPEAVGPGSDRVALENMAKGAETLALAYFYTAEERYAQRATLYIKAWFLDPATKMNPHLRFGQAIPGRTEGRGIGIIETRRFCQILNALALLEGSPALTQPERDAVREWFKAYLGWLRTHPNGKAEQGERNNHGTWYDVQAAHFALYTGDKQLAKEILTGALKNRLAEQVKPDGSQPHELGRTRAYTYSLINLSGLLDLAELGRQCDVDYWNYPSANKSLLREAVAFVGAYADPEKKWGYQQITGFDAMGLYPFLREAYYYTGEERYKQMLGKLPAEAAARERASLLWPSRK